MTTPRRGDQDPPRGATGRSGRLPSSRVELASSATDRSKETNTANTVARTSASGSASGVVCAVSWRARLCALAGVLVVAGLGSPGVARAASPAGGSGLAEQVQLALSQLGEAVHGSRGFSSASGGVSLNIPSTIPWGAMPAAVEGAIPTSVAAAIQPSTTNSGPAASVFAGTGSPPSAFPGPDVSGQERGAAKSGRSERAQGSLARAASRSEVDRTGGRQLCRRAASRRCDGCMAPTGLARRAPPGRAAKPAGPPAGAVPQRLPPRPLPPQPDMSSSGTGGRPGPACDAAARRARRPAELFRLAIPASGLSGPGLPETEAYRHYCLEPGLTFLLRP